MTVEDRSGALASIDLSSIDLSSWFAINGRDLLWRRTRDPWAILVSEVMLQQTQVSRVAERWPMFMRRFPTPPDCASAPVADVIGLWDGMGFNRRAVNLHRSAVALTVDHEGQVPDSLDELLRLPGVGPYTARAVLAFAFEQSVAVLDTNVGRILARVHGRRLAPPQAQALADRAVVGNDAWTWNQAMLDVGATICRARSTECDSCPMSRVCRWRIGGQRQPDPAVASAGVSAAQGVFEGSDRQGRGRLIAALRQGPVRLAEAPAITAWPDDPERTNRIVDALVADGLAQRDGKWLRLPE